MASHSGTANPIFMDSWVVGVNVYGRIPSRFRVIRKISRDANRSAHLCPGLLIGRNNWCVNCWINHACRVSRRLFEHRFLGVGNKIHGRVSARTTSGIPR